MTNLEVYPSKLRGTPFVMVAGEPFSAPIWCNIPEIVRLPQEGFVELTVESVVLGTPEFKTSLLADPQFIGLSAAFEATSPQPGTVVCGSISGVPMSAGEYAVTVPVSLTYSGGSYGSSWDGFLTFAPALIMADATGICAATCADPTACNFIQLDCSNPNCAYPLDAWHGEQLFDDFEVFEQSIIVEADPEASVSNAHPLQRVMVNLEHSYGGDLEIELECPTGDRVLLLEYPHNLGRNFLGLPVDLLDVSDPGLGYSYSFSDDPTALEWSDAELAAVPFTTDHSFPPGTYQSFEAFDELNGCPVAGTWTLRVTDNIAIDNGHVFSWGLSHSASTSATCDAVGWAGCMDPAACNYDPYATESLDICSYRGEGELLLYQDLDGNNIFWNSPDVPCGTSNAVWVEELDLTLYANDIGIVRTPREMPWGTYTVHFLSLDGRLTFYDGEPQTLELPLCEDLDVPGDATPAYQSVDPQFSMDWLDLRCSEASVREIAFANHGLEELEGFLTLTFDPSIEVVVSGSPNQVINQSPGFIEWFVPETDPNEARHFAISIQSVEPSGEGQQFTFEAQADLTTESGESLNWSQTETVGVNCALDPWQLMAHPIGAGPEHLIEAGDWVRFHVDYRNAANFVFTRVEIECLLDPDVFDLTSFRRVHAGAINGVSVWPDGRIVHRILQPLDTYQNSPEDIGFVEFEVRVRPDVAAGTFVQTQAVISPENVIAQYNDVHIPKITNTFFHTIASCGPGAYVDTLSVLCNQPIELPEYPITDGWVEISWEDEVLAEGSGPFSLDAALFESGSHLLTISLENPLCEGSNLLLLSVDGLLADLDGDGVVSSTDFLQILGSFGCSESCSSDLDGDGEVGSTDLLLVLGGYGDTCP